MVVKDNHPLLKKKIASFFASPCLYEAQFHRAREETLGRGRQERRSITVSDDLPRGFTSFAGVRQVFCLERQVVFKRTGEVRSETLYGMSSLARCWSSAEQLLGLARGPWTIENRVHYSSSRCR